MFGSDDLPVMMASAAVRYLWLVVVVVVVVSRGEDRALSCTSESKSREGLVRDLGSGIADRSVAAVVMEEKGGVGVSMGGSELRVISNWVSSSSSSDWDCDSSSCCKFSSNGFSTALSVADAAASISWLFKDLGSFVSLFCWVFTACC